ncbi:MAG TPA: Rne/Rng family ribonuclease [Limnochordia bacterium]|nr:Rne/Rng family ribonuclease [Limnochordia bacterium]
MLREIVVNAGFGETRAAVLEDRRAVELYIEREDHQRVVGNIYLGRVENVLPGMQAAFVDIGLERNSFLYVDDALAWQHAEADPAQSPKKARAIGDVVKPGQRIVVQVTKEPIGTKGARVVTEVTIPGRYLVLMPTVDYIGVSRRIADEAERNRLKAAAAAFKPEGMGLIVRTVAEGRSKEELAADCEFLVRVWQGIQRALPGASPPALLYKDYDLVYRMVRDRLTAEIDKFTIDDEVEYRRCLDWLDSLSPKLKERVYLYRDGPPIFSAYGVEPEIERALERRVWLDCGGYVVIDHTEALVSIDVNTGKFTGSVDLADTVLKTNLEAATEIARQLRLRDMGGIIIIDFIDMDDKEHERLVLERLESETRKDKTKTHVLGFTELGLVEMTRKKVKEDISDQLHRDCPYCKGTGRVLSEASTAIGARREIVQALRANQAEALLIELHPAVAALVIGSGGVNLKRLEEETGRSIFVRGRTDQHLNKIAIVACGSQAEIEAMALPVKRGQRLSVRIDEAHVSNAQDGIARVEGYVLDVEKAGELVGRTVEIEITRVFRTYAKARLTEPEPA